MRSGDRRPRQQRVLRVPAEEEGHGAQLRHRVEQVELLCAEGIGGVRVGGHPTSPAARMFSTSTAVVSSWASVGLNSISSVPAKQTGVWPGGA